MDIMKCKRVRKMVDADPMLYKDRKFYDMYIKPCKDETTQVYIDTFYKIHWGWIQPISSLSKYPPVGDPHYDRLVSEWNKSEKKLHIENVIRAIPIKYFTLACKSALRDCLIDLELLSQVARPTGPPCMYIDNLADVFRWTKPGPGHRIRMVHRRMPYTIENDTEQSGRDKLEELLEFFEETVVARGLKINRQPITKDKIEQMKRYLILMLIGVVQNPDYVNILEESLDGLQIKLYSARNHDQDEDGDEIINLIEKIKNLEEWMDGVKEYF
jgi:hypothetical protein